jgi:hypothetical protein
MQTTNETEAAMAHIPSGNRFDTIEHRGPFTIRRDEIRFGGYRVAWVVNGPGAKERGFSTRRAARRFCDANTPSANGSR